MPGADTLLEEERDAWRPFEALDGLTDAQLDAPVVAAHDWSGRDVIAHLVAWLDDAVAAANASTSDEQAAAITRSRRAFAARGDEINADIQGTWRTLPIAEVRRRMRETPAALRGRLAALPEWRWGTNEEAFHFFHVYTIEHYQDHVDDLAAILEAARRAS